MFRNPLNLDGNYIGINKVCQYLLLCKKLADSIIDIGGIAINSGPLYRIEITYLYFPPLRRVAFIHSVMRKWIFSIFEEFFV